MDGPRGSPVTMTATKKTMSRSFLIDSLIGGGVKHPIAGTATAAAGTAMPYHPQLNEYIQFLNRTAAAYGYQSPAPVVFPSSASAAIAAGPRFFGYPVGGGGFGRDHHHQQHHKHQSVVKPVAVVATGHRVKHAKTPSSKKRTVDEMITYEPGNKSTTWNRVL